MYYSGKVGKCQEIGSLGAVFEAARDVQTVEQEMDNLSGLDLTGKSPADGHTLLMDGMYKKDVAKLCILLNLFVLTQ